ncbi:hypothetical protein BURKHO8Y_70135 [Burkholderia sp. 8Y]|nr:hypothetical protein BURKHO8Y_70135 [Burkholderia sp. 8Y]
MTGDSRRAPAATRGRARRGFSLSSERGATNPQFNESMQAGAPEYFMVLLCAAPHWGSHSREQVVRPIVLLIVLDIHAAAVHVSREESIRARSSMTSLAKRSRYGERFKSRRRTKRCADALAVTEAAPAVLTAVAVL